MPRRYVILDRDGTIIEEQHYLSDPAQVKIIPGVIEALHALRELGLGLVVVTNQSGLGRGIFDNGQLELVHQRMLELLSLGGIQLGGIYFCPHRPEAKCDCRKPCPGMALQAARDLNFAPAEGFVIGDRVCDIEMGKNLTAETFLVRTGYGSQVEAEGKAKPDFIVDSLKDVVPIIGNKIKSTQKQG